MTGGAAPGTLRRAATAPLSLASVGRRLGALVYEILLLTALVLVAGFLLAPVVSPGAGPGLALQVPALRGRIVSFTGAFVVTLVYCVWSWSDGRRTLPMNTWRLGLRCVDGTVPGRLTATQRFLACWIGPALALVAYLILTPAVHDGHAAWLCGLNFLFAAVDPERQFLHDRIAGTRIVNDR